MANQNRFGGMFNSIKADEVQPVRKVELKPATRAQKPIEPKAKNKKPVAKFKDPNYSQIGLYLPNELHQKMKIASAMTGLEMSDLTAQALEDWLSKNAPDI